MQCLTPVAARVSHRQFDESTAIGNGASTGYGWIQSAGQSKFLYGRMLLMPELDGPITFRILDGIAWDSIQAK